MKSFLQSKTILVNTVAALIVIVVFCSVYFNFDLPGFLDKTMTAFVVVVPMINIYLRFITKDAINLTLPKREQ